MQDGNADNLLLWLRLKETDKNKSAADYRFFQVKQSFLSDTLPSSVRIEMVRTALRTPDDQLLGITIVWDLSEEERKQCLPELVALAGSQHSPFDQARRLILSLPHRWTIEHVESEVERHLTDGDEDDYRRFLELYSLLDPNLVSRLSQRAIQQPNTAIQEVGEEFTDNKRVRNLRSFYDLD